MTPADQQIFDLGHGDCFRACVASVLDLPIEEVPNFMEHPGSAWWTAVQEWLTVRGLTVEVRRGKGGSAVKNFPRGYWIASGKSPRGDHHHAVVFHGGELEHDPHPDRTGLDGPPLFSYVINAALDGKEQGG